MFRFQKIKQITAIILCIAFLCSIPVPAYASDTKTISTAEAAEYQKICSVIDDLAVQLVKTTPQAMPAVLRFI